MDVVVSTNIWTFRHVDSQITAPPFFSITILHGYDGQVLISLCPIPVILGCLIFLDVILFYKGTILYIVNMDFTVT